MKILYLLVLLVCPISMIFMMKNMHGHSESKSDIKNNPQKKNENGCH